MTRNAELHLVLAQGTPYLPNEVYPLGDFYTHDWTTEDFEDAGIADYIENYFFVSRHEGIRPRKFFLGVNLAPLGDNPGYFNSPIDWCFQAEPPLYWFQEQIDEINDILLNKLENQHNDDIVRAFLLVEYIADSWYDHEFGEQVEEELVVIGEFDLRAHIQTDYVR